MALKRALSASANGVFVQLLILFCLSFIGCDSGYRIIHIEEKDRNGHPEHVFSYYLDEKGEKVLNGLEVKWYVPNSTSVDPYGFF